MITLDALNLHLPSGMQERAPTIARLIAGELSRLRGEASEPVGGNISQLNIGALHIHRSFSDAQIAQTIVSAINEKMQHQLTAKAGEKKLGGAKAVTADKQSGLKRQGGKL